MLMACISGMNRGESPCWPGLVSRATGRQRRSAARGILVVSPPRERPIASRPVFLSFAKAPRAVISGRDTAGPGRVLVRAVDRGIGADRPALALGLITSGPQPVQDLLPGAIQRPAAMPVIDGFPVPEPLGQIPPRAARRGAEEDPVDHHPVISQPPAARRLDTQQRSNPRTSPYGTAIDIRAP